MLQLKRLTIFLLCLSLTIPAFCARKKGARLGQEVSFQSEDGVIISGLYVPAGDRSKTTFILLHGLGSNQEEWQAFAHKLLAGGYGFFSYDARGHGDSTLRKNGLSISYQSFGNNGNEAGWPQMTADLDKAVKYLISAKGIPEKKIGVMGASLGANIALVYSAGNTNIKPIVLLSPGMDYAGIRTESAILQLNERPVLIAASPGDTYAFQSAQLLYRSIQQNRKALLLIGDDGFHGVQMFNGKFDQKLMNWLRK
jgi:alpha-beta hydrolase superfamily lysophospholipase